MRAAATVVLLLVLAGVASAAWTDVTLPGNMKARRFESAARHGALLTPHFFVKYDRPAKGSAARSASHTGRSCPVLRL